MWCARFGKNLKHECRNVTLHGFISISNAKSIWEIIFWILMQLSCFALCLWLMAIHLFRYQSRPTVTTIKSTAYPISDIPFPAVTVCNSNIVYKKNTIYYEEILLNEGINQTQIDHFFDCLKYLIHLSSEVEADIPEFKDVEDILKSKGITTDILMKNLAHPCNELLTHCTWSGVTYNCSEMFRPIKSGMGFCCSFNYHNNDKTGEKYSTNMFAKPLVADGAGMVHGLSLSINIESNQYVSAVLPFYAVFVLVHSIWDYGDLSAFSVALQPGDYAMMQLIPTVSTSDTDLRSVSVNKRNCWFENEGNLRLTQDYSFANCVIECKTIAIYHLCGCIPYYYPSLPKHQQCNLQNVPCLKKYELIYNSIQITDKFVDNSTLCNCLPQCQDISYDGYLNSMRSEAALSKNTSTINIYYDHSWCVEYSMSLNLTWDMLLASLGGIFGLCLGGSLISIVEIVYYLIKCIFQTFSQGQQITTVNKFTKHVEITQKY